MKPTARGPKTIVEAPARARPSVVRDEVKGPSDEESQRRPQDSVDPLAHDDKLALALDAGALQKAAKGGLAMGDPTTFENIDEPGDGFIDNPDFCGTDTGGESELTLGERTSPLAAPGIRLRPIRSIPLRAPDGGSSTPRSIPAVARRVVEPAVPLTGPAVRIANGRLSVVAVRRSTWRSVIKREWFELTDAEEFLDVETLTSTTARTGSAPRGARRQENGQSFWNAHDEHRIDRKPTGEHVSPWAGEPMFLGKGGQRVRLWNLGIVPYCFSNELRSAKQDTAEWEVLRAYKKAVLNINASLMPGLELIQMPEDECPDDPTDFMRAAGPFLWLETGSTKLNQSLNDLTTYYKYNGSLEYNGPLRILLNPNGRGKFGTAVHEIGHAIGLDHMTMRRDHARWYRVRSDDVTSGLDATVDPENPALSVPGYWGDQEPTDAIPIIDSVDYLSKMSYDRIYFNNEPKDSDDFERRVPLYDLNGNAIPLALSKRNKGFSRGDVSRLQHMYHHMRHPGWTLFQTLGLPKTADKTADLMPRSPYLADGVSIALSPAISSGQEGTVIVVVGSDRRLYARWIEPTDEGHWRPVAESVISPAGIATDPAGTIHVSFWRDGEAAPRWGTLHRDADPNWSPTPQSRDLRTATRTRAPLLAINGDGIVECAVALSAGNGVAYAYTTVGGLAASWGAASPLLNGEFSSAASAFAPRHSRFVVVAQRVDATSPQVDLLIGRSFGEFEFVSQRTARLPWPGAVPIAVPDASTPSLYDIVCASRAFVSSDLEDDGDFPIFWRCRSWDHWEPLGGRPDVSFAPSACRRFSPDGSVSGGRIVFVEQPVTDAVGAVMLPGGLWSLSYE